VREQHDAEFTSYIEHTDFPGRPWMVVFKEVTVGFYRTRAEARMRIRALKPFSKYRPLTDEEKEARREVSRLPWGRFTAILRGLYGVDRPF